MGLFHTKDTLGLNTITKKIRSFELENVPEQIIEVDNFMGVFAIEAQGDDIYLYCKTRVFPTSPGINPYTGSLSISEPTEVKIMIVRTDEEYSDIRGLYIKTIIIRDIAYHFFCNHSLDKN